MSARTVLGGLFLAVGADAFSMGMNLAAFAFYNATQDHFKSGVDFAITTNPWKDVVVDELSNFDCIRFMKSSAVGGGINSLIAKWTDRAQKTASDQYSRYNKIGCKGTAYEWQILLATLAKADLWTNIPPDAISAKDNGKLPDFPVRLALLIKTGIDTLDIDLTAHMNRLYALQAADLLKMGGLLTISPLPEEQNIYIEYGNELWTERHDYTTAQAEALGLTYNGKVDYHLYVAWAQLQIWRAFHAVFGTSNPRVIRLCAGKSTNPWVTGAHLSVFDDPTWNPEGFGLMGYAVAPYAPFGSATKNISDVSQLYEWLPKIEEDLKEHQALLQPRGVQLIAYEGGQQIFPDTHHVNSDPKMGAFYTEFWNTVAPYFNGVFNHFVYARPDFGLKACPGQPDREAHKWTATMEWYKAHKVSKERSHLFV